MRVADLTVGDLIAFQIAARDGYSAPNLDKWGVFKILHVTDDGGITVSVLDGLHTTCPKALSLRFTPVLVENRFAANNPRRAKTAIFAAPPTTQLGLKSARRIGRERILRAAEKAMMPKILADGHPGTIAAMDQAQIMLDHEHRAIHDTARWQAEIKAASDAFMAKHQAKLAREKARLKTLTLETMARETAFAAWDERAAIVPAAYTAAARQQALKTLNALQALGPKPGRAKVRKTLRALAEWFTKVDGKMGYAIETEEREDIAAYLEELCWATGQKALVAEIDNWRDW